ncbi:hypothetical protein EUX98_g2281 [Antrodiella citrinella]|uniref:F-box domain-containing protein n=1 Tax=Antrodiella citrinella TaxID=2447956 RepID=A0A4S4MZE2_9APHY|nr:hypothetical protein EUX98_g2281 [Antrodiella citrinella]
MIFRASNTSSFAQTLLPHSHRVKTLATVLSHPEDIVLLGTVSLPEIRTVLFSCNTLQYPFPFAQFSTVAVAHLTNADIGFTTVNLANLTWLVIDNSIHYLPSLVDVISVLRNAPALVQVGLMGCAGFTREDLTALRSTQVIQMQKLRTLYISSEAIYIREFFNVVSVSALAQIALHVRMPLAWQRVGGTNICSISLPTAEKFHHVGCLLSANIIAVELRGDKPGLSCVDKTTGGALQWTYTATDTYTAASPYFWQDLIEDFAEAIGHLSMDRIANFSLSLRDDPFAEEELHFVPLFRALPNMHMLLVQAQRAEGVLGALTYLQDTACELGVAVCPRLSVLRLQDLVVDDSVVEKLLDCFLMRKDTCDEGLDYLLLAIGSVRLDTKHLARLEEEEFRTIVCEAE